MNEFIENLRKQCSDSIEETPETTSLHLTREEFMVKMKAEKDGWQLLDLLEQGEWKVAERLGLISGYREGDKVYFDVPRWNNLVEHLKIVNSV